MNTQNCSVKEFTTDQAHAINDHFTTLEMQQKACIPVITVCMQPGSGGHLIASEIAQRLDVELYGKNILVPMANTVDAESRALDSIEKDRPSQVQDFISSLLNKDYVYTGDYLQYLKDIVTIIGKMGHGVIIGRGANFILPAAGRFSIRVVAPLDIRIKNVAFKYGVSLSEAKKRIKHREQKRKIFIRESFHKDIADIMNYDLVINTARMSLDAAVETVIGAIIGSQADHGFDKENTYILRNRK